MEITSAVNEQVCQWRKVRHIHITTTEGLLRDNFLKVYSANEDKIIDTKDSFCQKV
jgi:hypothetical protein